MALVTQPTAAPTRKWSANLIAEAVVILLGVAAKFGFAIEISAEDVGAVFAGFAIVTSAVGSVVSYFTKNRAPA